MPRIAAESLAAHRQLVRQRILAAFGAELHDHGFAHLTLAAVAARAGVARNTIYNYAADKDELMLAYVENSVAEFISKIRSQLELQLDAKAKLGLLIDYQVRSFLAEPGAGSATGMLEGGSLDPNVFAELMARLSPIHGLIAEVLAEGISSGQFATTSDQQATVEMIGAVVGAQRMPVGEGRRDVDTAIAQTTHFVFGALGLSD